MQSTATVDELSALLDLTPRRVQQLAKEGVIPKPVKRGQYDTTACITGYVRSLRRQLEGEGGNLLAERSRLAKAQADKTELEVALRRGEVAEVSEVVDTIAAMISASRAKMLTIPIRTAPRLVNKTEKEIKKLLDEAVREALAELSEWRPKGSEHGAGNSRSNAPLEPAA